MIWNKSTFFDEQSAYERVRGKGIAGWYREQTDDQLRERIQWLKDCVACENHTAHRRDVFTMKSPAYSEGFVKCKCGAMKWDSGVNWKDMPSDDRDKFEEEIFTLTQYFAEMGGVYSI